jgi:pSer/pThr/pTyr-binding forkhead associated (FHA) protein
MSARLVGWIHGSGRFDRSIASVVRLGATPDNEVSIPVDGVSRQHATITEEGDGYWIEDARSKNGTWINGERATTRQKLNHLDVITLGRFAEFVFLTRGAEAATVIPVSVRVRLEWLNGPAAGTFVDVAQGETILGRADSCGIVVDNGAISRAHVRITHSGDRVAIEDLGSANGTAVDGRPLSASRTLESGAEVELGGERRFRIHIEGGAAAAPQSASGPAAGPTQDMEWMTRLVWSESDLEAVRAGLLAGRSSDAKRDPSGSRPTPPAAAASTGTPVPPPAKVETPSAPPAVPAPKTALVPPPAPAVSPIAGQPGSVSGATKLGLPALGAPPVPSAPVQAGTVIDEPEFRGAPPVGPGAAQATRLDIDAPTPALPGELARQRPVVPRRPAVQRPDLPPASVLGYRDVAPGAPRSTNSGAGQPRTDVPASTPGLPLEPIRGVRLSGTAGTFELAVGTVATIGRSEQATVRIDSRDVSRVHAVLTIGEQGVALEDKGSVNGTLLNGAPLLGTRPLGDGDHIAIADFEFHVEFLRTDTKP